MIGPRRVLVRYGEIGIKGRVVRSRFERILVENLSWALSERGVEAAIRREWGRIHVDVEDVEGGLDALRHTFGVVSASVVLRGEGTPEGMANLARQSVRIPPGKSFAVRPKRAGVHPFTSPDVARIVGKAILEANPGSRVDLGAPDVEVHVEVRGEEGFLVERTVEGPGGLPTGSEGRALVLVTRPLDLLAAWCVARRGVRPILLNAGSHPLDGLRAWIPNLREIPSPPLDPKEAIERAEEWAHIKRCEAIVVGETVEELLKEGGVGSSRSFPILRPLLGFPGERLFELAQRAQMEEVLG